jgi:hypothetical protein
MRRTWSTPHSALRTPPCICTFLSSLGENASFNGLLRHPSPRRDLPRQPQLPAHAAPPSPIRLNVVNTDAVATWVSRFLYPPVPVRMLGFNEMSCYFVPSLHLSRSLSFHRANFLIDKPSRHKRCSPRSNSPPKTTHSATQVTVLDQPGRVLATPGNPEPVTGRPRSPVRDPRQGGWL